MICVASKDVQILDWTLSGMERTAMSTIPDIPRSSIRAATRASVVSAPGERTVRGVLPAISAVTSSKGVPEVISLVRQKSRPRAAPGPGLEAAHSYAINRVQSGKPIATFQLKLTPSRRRTNTEAPWV